MSYYFKVLKNYAGFSGRARRKEFWLFVLFNLIVGVAAMVLDNVLGLAWQEVGYGPIYALYTLFVLIPGLAVSIRRLHDVGKSGWMILVALIPIIGAIWLIVLYCTNGEPRANAHGPDPKAMGA